jgi:O-antigen ligase
MSSATDLKNYSQVSAKPKKGFALGGLLLICLLTVSGLMANAPGPRRVFLFAVLIYLLCVLFRDRNLISKLRGFLPWCAVVGVSALWSPMPLTTLVDALWQVWTPIAAFFLAMWLAENINGERFSWLFISLSPFVILVALGGLHEHLGWWADAPQAFFSGYAGRGVASTQGVFLVVIGVALLSAQLVRPSRNLMLIVVASSLVFSGFLMGILGYNRIFWFALLIAFIPWLGLFGRLTLRRKGLLGACVLVMVLAGALYALSHPKTPAQGSSTYSLNEVGETLDEDPRWYIWRRWLEVAEQKPWLGWGYGGRLLPRIGEKQVPSGFGDHDWAAQHHGHNVLINVLVQTGFLGLLAFSWMMYSLLNLVKDTRQCVRDRHENRIWRVAAYSLIAGALAKSMTDDFFWGPAGIMMWVFLGAALGMARRPD